MDKVESLTALLNKLQEENDALRHAPSTISPTSLQSASPTAPDATQDKIGFLEKRLHQLQIDFSTLTDTQQHLLKTNRDLEKNLEDKQDKLMHETSKLQTSRTELELLEQKMKLLREELDKKSKSSNFGMSLLWLGGVLAVILGYFALQIKKHE
jgi:chromosome segregation ATPase